MAAGKSDETCRPPLEAPFSDDPHRKVEIGLRLALNRLKEVQGIAMSLDRHHTHLIGELILSLDSAHASWCKTWELTLRATEIRWKPRKWESEQNS